MKSNLFFMAIICTSLLSSCKDTQQGDSSNLGTIIGKATPTIENGIMTPEILHSFGRIGNVEVSPNKEDLLYHVTFIDIEKNKTNTEIFKMKVDGSDKKQLTFTNNQETSGQWIEDGSKIAFMSIHEGSNQLWEMHADGSGLNCISDVEGGIEGFTYSPDGKKVMYIKSVKSGKTVADQYPDLPNATGKVVDELMYKHWDHWVEKVPHTFYATIDKGKLTNHIDLLEGEPYEAPLLPFGGTGDIAWSPDSKSIVYVSKKMTGKEYAESTNSDLYLYSLVDGTTENITEGMMGYDVNPKFSHDGSHIAWLSMERDGYEADKNRLFVMDMATKEKTYLTDDFDNNVDAFIWNTDNKTLFFIATVAAKTQLFSIAMDTKKVNTITSGKHDYVSIALGNDDLIAKRQSMLMPAEI